MFQLGNKLGLRRSAPVERSQAESAASLQDAQMAAGKAYQVKADELVAARSHLEERQREEGEKDVDGENVTSATLAVQAAAMTVKRLESAVAVLLQRKQEAKAAFRNAMTAEKREALHKKLVELADLGRTVDAQWAENGKLAAKAITLIGEVKSCAFGDSEINGKLVDARMYFRRTLLDTCEAMPGCWTGEDLYKTRRPWSSSLPTPEMANRVK